MASFLARALDLPTTERDYFSDDTGSTHEGAVNRIAAAGIAGGCADGRYCPADIVTRGQLAAFLTRAFGFPQTSDEFFSDVNESTYVASINRTARAGVTSGCASHRYCPTEDVNREQMAAFLHRALDSASRGSAPPKLDVQPAGTTYGSLGADSLWNTHIGGTECSCANQQVSYRFRARYSSQVEEVRVYIKGTGQSGYAGGTGGTISVRLMADNGSGLPSNTTLAQASFDPPAGASPGVSISLAPSSSLTAGRLYHVVFRNTDSKPNVNFVSLNGIAYLSGSAIPEPRHPLYSDMDWAELVNKGSGWSVKQQIMPIMAVHYASGASQGVGVMESWIEGPKEVSGSRAVRQRFAYSAATRDVDEVWLRLRRVGGPGALRVRLETSTGARIGERSVGASSVSTDRNHRWVRVSLPARLMSGETYHLVLSAPSDTTYQLFALRGGSRFGYPGSTHFQEGVAEFTDGSGWLGFNPPWSGSASDEADLQFYFK